MGPFQLLTWNPAESPVCDVLKQLNVLHQAASCSSCYDIPDIAIHVYSRSGVIVTVQVCKEAMLNCTEFVPFTHSIETNKTYTLRYVEFF
ncbi:hypothetical protein CSKR_106393 [Clonorchis sinensis]|uniref:Uncharacterized protein n=1 Tax=Clonorchis sinensis TaxID=79923 RepID=A0A3R7G2P1_CLOSI|nr:hypothetical protein CSKR_106393 [Clonorchis sinensis]